MQIDRTVVTALVSKARVVHTKQCDIVILPDTAIEWVLYPFKNAEKT